jgi:hypothetical protein
VATRYQSDKKRTPKNINIVYQNLLATGFSLTPLKKTAQQEAVIIPPTKNKKNL